MRETILIATLGAAPQVVTLALDALLAAGAAVSRVIVVHTLPDREPIRSSLARLRREFLIARRYGEELLFVPHLLAGQSGPLLDLTTPREIDEAFQSLYTLLRQHKQAGRLIHLSIAGGRKTMALFAMAAAQILFDADDRVWHLSSRQDLMNTKALHTEDPEAAVLIPVPVAAWGHLHRDSASMAEYFLHHVLTPAEREVTELLIREGLSNMALAERLGKSPKTIANQLTSVYAKFGQYFNLSSPPDRALLLVFLGRYS